MKIIVRLSNSTGELDTEIAEWPHSEAPDSAELGEVINDAVHELVNRCVFAIGDVITIAEIGSFVENEEDRIAV